MIAGEGEIAICAIASGTSHDDLTIRLCNNGASPLDATEVGGNLAIDAKGAIWGSVGVIARQGEIIIGATDYGNPAVGLHGEAKGLGHATTECGSHSSVSAER